MSKATSLSYWALGGMLFPVLAAAVPLALTSEAARRSADASDLRPVVVVDPDGSAVYAMSPEGGIDAVAASSGELLWSTREAAAPLALYADLLIAQAQPAERGVLDVVFLDRRTGEPRRALSVALPEEVWGAVDEGLGTRFEARAVVRGGDPFVSWEHTRLHAQGIAPAPGEALEQKSGGAYRLDLQAGRAIAVEVKALEPDWARRTPDAVKQWMASGKLSRTPAPAGEVLAATRVVLEPAPERIVLKRWDGTGQSLPDVELFSGPFILDLRSADHNHLLVAESVAPEDWDEYRWSVFSLETGQLLGQVRNHRSHAWYAVRGAALLYVEPPYGRRLGADWVVKPPMLRAVRLDTGALVWERPLRDISFRGPFPP